MEPIQFRTAQPADWEAVAALLETAHLPLDGAHENLSNFILAFRGNELVGCAGLEHYQTVGLLRSVAVRDTERGLGLGQALTKQLLALAQQSGLQQLILLTETAQGFFPKFGFAPIPRSAVPTEALASVEFTTACPDSAIVMSYVL